MRRMVRTCAALMSAWLLAPAYGADAAAAYKIVTASERGTYIQIGRDLAKFVAPRPRSISKCCRRRDRPRTSSACATSPGSSSRWSSPTSTRPSSTRRTPAMPRRRDHPAAARDHAALQRGDLLHRARRLAAQLRARDQGRKINVGPLRSGTAMSATTLYRQMFGAPLPTTNACRSSATRMRSSSWSATSRSTSWSSSPASRPSCWST